METDFLTTLFAVAANDLLRLRLVEERPLANPAAGNEIIAAPTGGVIWEIVGLRYTLTTSAAVANRASSIVIRDGDGNITARFPSVATVAASVVTTYTYYQGQGAWEALNEQSAPLPSPGALVQPGWSIRTSTTALDVGDQYSTIVLTVRAWDETAIMQETESIDEAFQSYISPRLGR